MHKFVSTLPCFIYGIEFVYIHLFSKRFYACTLWDYDYDFIIYKTNTPTLEQNVVHPGANGSISRSIWRVRDRGNTVTYMLGLITETGQSAGLIIAKTILDQVWSH